MSVIGRRAAASRPAAAFRHPGRVITGAFAAGVVIGTLLLSLPFATATGDRAPLMTALFTATSAVCVTGLVIVDTGTFWSGYGQAIILLLIQIGGLGIMTMATLVALLFSRRLGLRARLVAQAETKSLSGADVRRVVRNVVLFSLAVEAALAVVLISRLLLAYDDSFGQAVYSGVFHAVSAFNNAGFGLYVDSLVRYVADPWIMLAIAVGVILGGLGFPVVFELARTWRRPRTWSVLTRVTVTVTAALLAVGTLLILIAEATNPGTLGPLDGSQTAVAGFFTAVMPRTAGFNAVDIAALRPETLLVTDALMFIGGGSASTAGGIKVTTFGLLAYVVWSEMRGDADVEVGRRRVPSSNQRQALSIALLAIGIIAVSTFALLALTAFTLDVLLFEVISAFSTVGLSTGITADLPPAGQLLLVALMFIGRVGPLTVASALAVRDRARRHQLPEERTIVG